MKTRVFFTVSILMGWILSISAQEIPFFNLVDCPFEIPAGEVEGQTIDCGAVTVPESRTGLSDANVELAVIILHATGEETLDPLLYLAGGPGNSATAISESYLENPLREASALIFLDQRGTGYSDPSLNCPEEDDDNNETPALDCYNRLVSSGVAVGAYRTSENAADVNDVISALALDNVNIYGISYGTRLALTVMKNPHPAIRAVILDGVYPPDVLAYEEDPTNIARVFFTTFEGCAEDPACDSAFPDLVNVFYNAVEGLNSNPIVITNADGEVGELTGNDLIDELFVMFYDTSAIPYIPALIYAAANRDIEGIEAFLSDEHVEGRQPGLHVMGSQIEEVDDNSEGLFYSIDCADEVPFNDVASVADSIEALELPESWSESLLDTAETGLGICDFWVVTPSNPNIRQATVSDLPTLLLNGEYDPVTPPRWGEHAAATLSNSYMFTMPAGGHGVINIADCPIEIAYQFLLDPYTEPDDSCVAEMSPPDWYLDYP